MSSAEVRIDLLRHGEVEGGVRFRGSRDDPLTPEGWEQMQQAVRDRGPWDVVVTSPLIRCRAFAEHLAAMREMPWHIDARLAEIHFGEWEGRSYAELMLSAPLALTQFLNDPLKHTPPGAEGLDHFQARSVEALGDLIALGQGGRRVLVITHGGVIRVLVCHARGWPLQRLLDVEVPHATLHTLCYDQDAC